MYLLPKSLDPIFGKTAKGMRRATIDMHFQTMIWGHAVPFGGKSDASLSFRNSESESFNLVFSYCRNNMSPGLRKDDQPTATNPSDPEARCSWLLAIINLEITISVRLPNNSLPELPKSRNNETGRVCNQNLWRFSVFPSIYLRGGGGGAPGDKNIRSLIDHILIMH